MLKFGMKSHLIDTHPLVQRSRSSAKVKVKYQGHISQKKNDRFRGTSVSQTHLVYLFFLLLFIALNAVNLGKFIICLVRKRMNQKTRNAFIHHKTKSNLSKVKRYKPSRLSDWCFMVFNIKLSCLLAVNEA